MTNFTAKEIAIQNTNTINWIKSLKYTEIFAMGLSLVDYLDRIGAFFCIPLWGLLHRILHS